MFGSVTKFSLSDVFTPTAWFCSNDCAHLFFTLFGMFDVQDCRVSVSLIQSRRYNKQDNMQLL